ncbi:DUF550 domain-containing protein, partial [Salmonella enterica subsp. enterica serovar Typhimurium]
MVNVLPELLGSLTQDDRIILALRELQKRRKASKEPVRYLNKFSGVCVTLEQQPNAS